MRSPSDEDEELAERLQRVIGRKLVAVTEARHWHGGQRADDASGLLHLWLNFQGVPKPLMAHGSGERLFLEFSEPYPAYDMGEFGETRVGPAREPDLLASLPGHRLLNAALIQNSPPVPSVGGVLLRFDYCDIFVASVGDEWLLSQGSVPLELATNLTVGHWLAGHLRVAAPQRSNWISRAEAEPPDRCAR